MLVSLSPQFWRSGNNFKKSKFINNKVEKLEKSKVRMVGITGLNLRMNGKVER
jgi:hypothetical protein